MAYLEWKGGWVRNVVNIANCTIDYYNVDDHYLCTAINVSWFDDDVIMLRHMNNLLVQEVDRSYVTYY